MPSYLVVYADADWEPDGLGWYQTIFQRVTATSTLIVSLVRATADAAPTIERAGIFAPIRDKHGNHWKLICWVQSDELVVVARR